MPLCIQMENILDISYFTNNISSRGSTVMFEQSSCDFN